MDIDALKALITVVETGSINQAASRLGVSRTTLGRRLSCLEASFGCPLLTTSRDGSVPTAAGARLAERGAALLRQVSELDAYVRLGLGDPGRLIRVAVSPGFHPDFFAVAVGQLRTRAPHLRLDIRVTSTPFATLPGEQPDLVVSFGRPQMGHYKVSKVVALPLTFKASPAYLEQHGRPGDLKDLVGHQVWAWDRGLVKGDEGLAVAVSGGGLHSIEPAGTLNDLHLLHVMVQSGVCIGLVPCGPFDVIHPDEEEVLPGQLAGHTGMWIAVPAANSELPWMRALIAEIRGVFGYLADVEEGANAPTDEAHAERP